MVTIRFGNRKLGGILFSMSESNLQRKWVREEVVILVTDYFRMKKLSSKEIAVNQKMVSVFVREKQK